VLTPVRMVVPVELVVRVWRMVVRGLVRSMVVLTPVRMVVPVELVVRVWRMVVRGPVRSMAELTAALVAEGSSGSW
jgi:hypothetical protein